MDKFIKFLEEKIMPVALKISQQRHMRAIRTGIISTLPLTIVGSFFVIFLNIPIPGYAEFIAPYKAIIDIPFRFTVGILSLYAAYGMGAALASSYDLDKVGSGFLAVLAFLISTVVPVHVEKAVDGVIGAGRYINIASLSSSSLFGAIVTSMIAVEIYRWMKEKNITVKMPEGVPPEVSNSFSALLPTLVVILLFWVIRHFLKFDISATLSTLLSPLKGVLAGNSLFGGLLTVFLITMFWTLGIHGPAILGPIIRPIWDMSIAENMQAFANGVSANNLPNLFTEQFLQWFLWIGGSGATLALVVMFLMSKSKYLKSLGRLSLLPGLFNINEPIIFGAPIVMNPILAIPFILAPMVMAVLSYFLTVTGVIPMMMARLPFTMPSPLAAVMSTNWSIMAGVLVVINFIISFVIYYPFFKVFEKQQLEKEKSEIQ
ncbi:PTS sugar transporter subunit IIC [Clostridium amazonitimonense]|uniref:PTS sugar transporter subunit IIC n=1 Tax=Clostridium amazonitimonense TaxID=1499689 RepID=UPI0005096C31|nr:PTS sugar transporter subunit IIC [Clostridium amazonitimonense]